MPIIISDSGLGASMRHAVRKPLLVIVGAAIFLASLGMFLANFAIDFGPHSFVAKSCNTPYLQQGHEPTHGFVSYQSCSLCQDNIHRDRSSYIDLDTCAFHVEQHIGNNTESTDIRLSKYEEESATELYRSLWPIINRRDNTFYTSTDGTDEAWLLFENRRTRGVSPEYVMSIIHHER